MFFKPIFRMFRNGQLFALQGAKGTTKSFYKLAYLAAAGEAGLLRTLAEGPATLEALADLYAVDVRGKQALAAWLQLGVCLRLLDHGTSGYATRALAERLGRRENDGILAMIQEVVGLHHKLITATIPKLRNGDMWILAGQDGELFARSSRVLEPHSRRQLRSISGISRLTQSAWFCEFAV